MSGDGCHEGNKMANLKDESVCGMFDDKVSSPRKDSSCSASKSCRYSGCSVKVPVQDKVNAVGRTKKLLPKMRYKMSKIGRVDSAEFGQNISSWFGEKGFTAMRSFFRASVLNSLQKDVPSEDQSRCSEMDAVMVILITDHLLRNSRYFTMSVFTNEVLRPLSGQSAGIRHLLQRVGEFQGENLDPVLTKDDLSYILRFLDVNPHSLLGAEVLHRYFEESQNLLDIFMGLLKDNSNSLSIKNRAVRDNDIVAAFTEGLNEELGKFQYWFSDLNNQFLDISVKLKKMVSMKSSQVCNADNRNANRSKEEQALWQRMLTMDDNLRRQQEALLRLRDKEKRKLVIYAKELEAMHKEMNAKLKSIQSYEQFLKQQERRMKGEVHPERNFILEKRGRGDYLSSGGNSENEVEVNYSTLNEKRCHGSRNVPNTREASTQKFGETLEPVSGRKCENLDKCQEVMEENLELKSILREQHLRIESLTKRVAALSNQSVDMHFRKEHNEQFKPLQKFEQFVPKKNSGRGNRWNYFPRNVSLLQTAVRRAKMELGGLKAEKEEVDVQYERMLNNKLSKN
ncbi:hypothetical protein GE061_002477 [Apolygus lucorum]|uniref:LisH domain-containing protein n=1 Tax=Apolygus lucorum TaxID=248454 RepID=A0A8S9X588_APOLU|nr:hypothetical protein GE061_002477 [Apolygus lucorum]